MAQVDEPGAAVDPVVTRRRTIDDLRIVRVAATDGFANGLRDHLPGGVGIVVKGGAVCVPVALLNLAVGVEVASTLIGVLSGAGVFGWTRLRGRGDEDEDPEAAGASGDGERG